MTLVCLSLTPRLPLPVLFLLDVKVLDVVIGMLRCDHVASI